MPCLYIIQHSLTSTHSILPQSSVLDPPHHKLRSHVYIWSVHIHGHAYARTRTHTHTHTCTHTHTNTHAHTHTHMHKQAVVIYTTTHLHACIMHAYSFSCKWGLTALLRAAYNGHAEVVRMLKDEFGSSLEEEENVSVYHSMCDDHS